MTSYYYGVKNNFMFMKTIFPYSFPLVIFFYQLVFFISNF